MKLPARRMALVCSWLFAFAGGAFAQNIIYTNPAPEVDDAFGRAVAGLGGDRVLVGAPYDDIGAADAGSAYLFDAAGALLTTITNPFPAAEDYFGWSVAPLGTDRLLVGIPYADANGTNSGAVAAFTTNGELLATFVNPVAGYEVWAGETVTTVGDHLVLVGADGDDSGGSDSGAAYLYDTNGTFLHAFTNPAPADYDYFGVSVAGVGSDQVLIGAYRDDTTAPDAGAAYLFSTNGDLLQSFFSPNPASNDWFGLSVAGVGSDRVLIGGLRDDSDGGAAAMAYLFNTNGALLAVFTNPAPASSLLFGYPVTSLGNEHVLVGAIQSDAGDDDAGAVYLFDTNGTLRASFSSPHPSSSGGFGYAMSAFGDHRILVGAWGDNTGASGAGVACWFSLSTNRPQLSIAQAGDDLLLRWLHEDPGWILEEAEDMAGAWAWTNAPAVAAITGETNLVQLSMPLSAGKKFFRLRQP